MSALDQQHQATPPGLELLERAELLRALQTAYEQAAAGRGRLVLLGGEAGVGKSALLRGFVDDGTAGRVLWGACERLFTPRALGPFLDIAQEAGGALAELVGPGAMAVEFFDALVVELTGGPATVLVVEDLHWADEGTLDVLKLLARRIAMLPTLALVSFRDDELRPSDPLQLWIGELAAAGRAQRHHLRPLSLDAVRRLALARGADAERLFETTGGNPFFVTEALASMGDEVPDTVRDAVLARAALLAPAPRRLLEAAAVVPSRIELWLLEAIATGDLPHLEACLGSGMLRAQDGGVAFRHELARLAVDEAIAPDRRLALHRAVLRALTSKPPVPIDPARLSHHAAAAGDIEAVVLYSPQAGDRAAALCSHREAAEQFARALRYAERIPTAARAELYERRSYECYLTDQISDAIEARRAALSLYEAGGDCRREADNRRWLSRLAWFQGDRETSTREAWRAVELLEREPAGRELAMAYSNAAQLAMLDSDAELTADYGGKAVELAERLGETEILVHSLNNVGCMEMSVGMPGGLAKLQRSLALAVEAELEEHVARAHTNLGSVSIRCHEYALADAHLTAGIAYCEEHDLDSWRLYMMGWEACLQLDQGRWDEAADRAWAVLGPPGTAVPSRITPLIVLGRLRARRGRGDPWAPLDEARDLAARTGELQRLAPVAAARAEVRWLEGAADAVAAETHDALALARARRDPLSVGELAVWRRRAGVDDGPVVVAPETPYAVELAGDWRGAAARWAELGCPYEAALARAGGDERALRDAHDALQRLGASSAARAVARRLRERGVTAIARGPRRSTVDNPAQLTARQLEILTLLTDRLTNAQIAARLFISPKTVDHHVSAIFAKLGVHTREEAGAQARRLGL